MSNSYRMTARELFDLTQKAPASHALTEAIRSFPAAVVVAHCGQTTDVSPFEIYATFPKCGREVKFRSFAAITEIQEVFDAVIEWSLLPEAQAIFRLRQQQITAAP